MDSSATALNRSDLVNRMEESIPNGTQKLLTQQGIPAATLHPDASPWVQEHIRFEQNSWNAYGAATGKF